MKIQLSSVSFCSTQKIYSVGDIKVKDFLDDNNILIRREKYDEFDRNTDTMWFNDDGSIKEEMHKDYFKSENEEGLIETFKSKTQEYTRKAYSKTENNLRHSIDDFQSKTGKSYYNDYIHDMLGNLVKIISNGKVIYP